MQAFCDLLLTGLHDSHNTSQEYVILYLLNVHLYICILSCNIFWQASIFGCIFLNEDFVISCMRLWEDWSNWSPCQLFSTFTCINWNAVHCIWARDGLIKRWITIFLTALVDFKKTIKPSPIIDLDGYKKHYTPINMAKNFHISLCEMSIQSDIKHLSGNSTLIIKPSEKYI